MPARLRAGATNESHSNGGGLGKGTGEGSEEQGSVHRQGVPVAARYGDRAGRSARGPGYYRASGVGGRAADFRGWSRALDRSISAHGGRIFVGASGRTQGTGR